MVKYYDKTFHTNHQFYVKDIARYSTKITFYVIVRGQNSVGKLQISYDEKAQKSHILCESYVSKLESMFASLPSLMHHLGICITYNGPR